MIVTNSGGLPVKTWSNDISEVETQAMEQAYRVSRLPFIFKHVALMPDVHLGKGACVGSVIASEGAVVPALVGVDIGCGMLAVQTNLTAKDLPDSLRELRLAIELVVPVGHSCHQYARNPHLDPTNLTVYNSLPTATFARIGTQVGTLGGGNHFIEICLDENEKVWIMLHSGSRNIGKEVAEIHIKNAKGLMKQLFINLEDPELAYFAKNTVEYQNYLSDVLWCQQYAENNRLAMFKNTFAAIKKMIPKMEIVGQVTSCHHNYISVENHFGQNVVVTRKGAISARDGELGIIPGSMGTKSYIVKGLGNKQSFCSCSHGAGRKMSRSEAKRTFTLEDLEKQTEGVECRKDFGAQAHRVLFGF